MLFVISPAKKLDFSAAPPSPAPTHPAFSADTAELAAAAKTLTAADLKRLMGISDSLAQLNVERFQAFRPEGSPADIPAAFAFAGDVYGGLKARELDAAALSWAQDRLRILSGLYGVLRPLDRIQPYRLEMGIKLATARGGSLYAFWGAKIAEALDAATAGQADPTIVNLASQEYFGAVDRTSLKSPVVSCSFKEEAGNTLKIVSFYAKTARGLMARFAIDSRAERIDDLRRFDRAGYRHRPDLSSEGELVFTRPHP